MSPPATATVVDCKCRWFLLAMACALSSGPGTYAAAVNDTGADVEPRQVGWPCTAADSVGSCLFKRLLSNAVQLFAANRRQGVTAPETAAVGQTQQSKGIEEYLLEQIQNLLGMFSFGFDLPAEVTAPWTLLKSSLFARGKKNKNLGPMMAAGFAVMAGTLVPIAFGALFMLAGKALTTSLLAITLSGLLGLKALFSKHEHTGHLKTYAPAPPHYASEALQYEQEQLGVYRAAQTEAKMHSSAGNYYGEANLSKYYKGSGEQLVDGSSDQPEYLMQAAATGNPKTSALAANNGPHPKFHGVGDRVKLENGGKTAD